MRPLGPLVLEHFVHPRNVGEIRVPDGVGVVGNPECGDQFKVWIRVQSDVLADVKYKVLGCPSAIACCSMMSELSIGKTLEEAYQIDDADILHALGGLPETKQHCSNHAAEALRAAITDFALGRRLGGGRGPSE